MACTERGVVAGLAALSAALVLLACSASDDTSAPADAGAGAGTGGGGASGASAGTGGGGGRIAGAGGASGSVASGAGGASGGGMGGAAGTAGPVACPRAMPTPGGPCAGKGNCSFATGAQERTLFTCYAGKWFVLASASDGERATDVCPADYNTQVGADCNGGQALGTCLYADDTLCRCTTAGWCSGVPPRNPLPSTWTCLAPQPDPCLLFPRSEGSECPERDLKCSPACCGTEWTCTASGWQTRLIQCPP